MKTIYVLTWHTKSGSEVRHAFSDVERAKIFAQREQPDLRKWKEHNGHGFCLVAEYAFKPTPVSVKLVCGSYSIVEIELD